ncbi:Outer membrane protein OprM precursor [Vibrio aerogenes CECT 7868]|uniref:Outer membrane protein OprM n=1 Tax=Vibrio aerogenes CECT 7868 TaxID=1216006 RepID=A0A1M6A107_9VIBR|nr:efflux transporter outer membrane subunit [Vibrio aerogenes]SHI30145.1 Outer membrane protein OprM precursor [Vibrio aerogenes CECT 7868]
MLTCNLKSPVLGIAISAILLSGCSSLTKTDFVPPTVDIPASWQTTVVNSQVSLDPWWKRFNDQQLNRLMTQVLRTNNDLALATLTLKKSRLQAGLSATDRYPSVSSTSSAKKSTLLDSGSTSSDYSTTLSLSYELDLWGHVSSTIDAAQWRAVASEADRESTAQTLVSTTASLYWKIGYLKDRIALSDKSIAYARQTLALTQRQFKSGSVSELDVFESKRSLAGQQATRSQLVQQLRESENAMAVLLNHAPSTPENLITTLPDTALPEIAAGAPAELLVRRPDVKASLYELKAALATSDATFASYLPTLTLTGSVGDSSSQLRDLLRDPIGTLGANLVLPFLQWNTMKINQKIAEVDYQTAVVNYRKTLYAAFEDVDNALSARQQYQYQGDKLKVQYDAATAAERIYASQYRHGAVSIQNWLDSQETQRSAQESLLENHYNQLNVQATIYQALGGSDIAPPVTGDK